uniref:Ig-like domain-containing protein n=1 Tax=Seriola lalandi dorsalis TaxID=1841481 RepID=A0A3B4WUS1_SERLL
MKTLLMLLLFCHLSSAGRITETHPYFSTVSSGVPNFPEVVAVALFWFYTNTVEPKQTWMKSLCCVSVSVSGVHILQRMNGIGFNQYGYDGEDFLSFDLKTLTWDAEKARVKYNENFLTKICPALLEKYVDYRKTVMFWMKDGEDLHEDVDQGEILPNHDGTFQMSVDLSSAKPEDWRRYDCVFQLSGVEDDIVTKLDKAVIRTNEEKPSNTTVPIITVVSVLTLILIAVTGFMVYKEKKAALSSERLNPET